MTRNYIALAEQLSREEDAEGIKEIVGGLSDKKKQVANDCIKVLYEVGERNPKLIADYVLDFIELLKSKENRLVWGGMTALSTIASLKPKEIYENFDTIFHAYENGSVITRDNSISDFAKLAKADKEYEKVIFPILTEHLRTCRPKEVGQHAERAFICVNKDNAEEFKTVLLQRRDDLTDSQKARLDKLLRKIEKNQFNP
jgi:HEAT repeat protein